MTDRPLVHLVDDDDAIRHSASFMLRNAGYDVKTYASGVEFVAKVGDVSRGCILLDVQMPEKDGLAVQAELNERSIAMPVIVLTGHGDVSVAVQAMKAGAVDFIEKPFEKAVLLSALNAAFERMQAQRPRETLAADARERIAKLTPRERDVLNGLVLGQPNKVIARNLDISPRTVEVHRANLMDKLSAANISDVLRMAFAAGLGV